jgi:hypothetical protein
MNDDHAHGEPAEPEAALPDANAVVEQVRELLFGDHRRANDAAVKSLEDRLAAVTATLEARFADLERRLGELKSEQDQARGTHAETLGAALVELGAKIRSLAATPEAKPSE